MLLIQANVSTISNATRAAEALRRAAELSPNDPEVRLALAEAAEIKTSETAVALVGRPVELGL